MSKHTAITMSDEHHAFLKSMQIKPSHLISDVVSNMIENNFSYPKLPLQTVYAHRTKVQKNGSTLFVSVPKGNLDFGDPVVMYNTQGGVLIAKVSTLQATAPSDLITVVSDE